MSTASTSTGTAVVANTDDDATARAIEDIRNGRALAYSSINAVDMASRMTILEAVTNSEPISDHLNETFEFENIIIQRVDMVDTDSGEVAAQPRIVFLTKGGLAVHAISQGLLRSVNNLLGIAGEPTTWGDDLPKGYFVRVGQPGRQYFTLKYGEAAKAKRS